MRDQNEGFALLVSLFVLTGLAMLINVGVTRSMTELLAGNRYVDTQQAFHLAEAGVDAALWEFSYSDGNFTPEEGWAPEPDPTICTAGVCYKKTVMLNAAVLVIDVTGTTPTIRATGSAGAVSQRLSVTVARPQTGFEFSLFGANKLQVGGTGEGITTVDSYNSAEGPYDPLAPLAERSNARIGTNDLNYAGATDNYVDLQIASYSYPNTATVYGKAYISPLVDLSYPSEYENYGSLVDGGAGPQRQPLLDLPPIAVPADLTELCGATPVDYTRSSGSELITTNRCYKSVSITNTGEMVLAPGVRVYLQGDGTGTTTVLNMTGQGKIVAQGQNQLFGGLGGFWVDSQYGFVNASDPINPRPKELVIRMEGSATYSSGLEQQASFYGALYIRRGSIWIKGNYDGTGWSNADHYGAIISGNWLTPTAHTAGRFLNFHADESLAEEDITLSGTGSSKRFQVLFWQELAPGEM